MKTLKIQFKSNDKIITKVAILDDTLNSISKSKRNQCVEINDDYINDGFWIVCFEGKNNTLYEVLFVYDDWQKTLEPITALTWENNVITDEQEDITIN